MPVVKELNYFCVDINPEGFAPEFYLDQMVGSGQHKRPRHSVWLRNEQEYLCEYVGGANYRYRLDASVSYLYSRVAAKHIHNFNNDSRILIILRDPVERAFSHYKMNVQLGYARRPFLDEVMIDFRRSDKGWGNSHLYVELGLYFEQVKRYLDVFGEDRVLIINYSSLRHKPNETIQSVLAFLGQYEVVVPELTKYNQSKNLRFPSVYRAAKSLIKKVGFSPLPSWAHSLKARMFYLTWKEEISANDRKRLSELFEEDQRKLAELVGFRAR